ncbi:dihydroxyacetone kinase subunit DhaK [Cryobacterium melibiosiphilum]|uniref:phosphoenolpyruvate--glycerone phosphotransferase n=1 Tax=Cryobacterium melibiosiphilum TaxID=995039 RepID=A0A3A5MIL9_9MICO|nr:dihydroxyacetone kinase subunit DhaK [Cryobacterium melibiosiphilum]RJT89242.1 dihydroxyacetone kinase subunit DhaK [Cryobacterium melibiosiphilum]
MKKLINDPKNVVTEAVAGFAVAHPDLVRVSLDPIYIVRADAPVAGKVGIVSGGGSGHEPMHGGLVGVGMLDAAVPGAVFTSPTPDPILAATQAVDGGAGVLHIVKNYTGDVLNFETAADLALAEGIEVASVIINDDVAVKDSLYTAGRRGVAGTVLVEKIAGAAAERGDDLASVAAVAEKVNASVRSMGVALTPCVVPHAGKPSFTLADDEIEIGIGIHGEPGRERIKMEPADAIVDRLLGPILEDLPFASGDKVLLFVNGMGGTPQVELYVVFRRAAEALAEQGIDVTRTLVGNFTTSLEMQGMSISVLKLDDELTTLWDAPVATAALRWGR